MNVLSRLGLTLLVGALFALALVLTLWLLAAVPGVGAEGETPVIVTNFPTQVPYPTAIPVPTWCATPLVEGQPICGLAAVNVAHANGEGGYQLVQAAALAFGLAFIGVCILVGQFVRR